MRVSFSGNVQGLVLSGVLVAIFICRLIAQNSPSEKSAGITLTHMGTAGWEISDGKTVVLVDPYLTRLKSNTPRDPALSSDPRPLITLNDFATSDQAVIDAHIKRADFILITHSILRRSPLAPQLPPPSTIFPADAKPPFRLGQLLVEGGTLAYLIRVGGQQVLVFWSMNYVEREVDGLRPDVALIGAMPERQEIYHYTERLLRALGYPRFVLPTHRDRFNVPYDVSQQPAIERLQSFVSEVTAASLRTEVIVPKYFVPVAVRPTTIGK